MRKTFQAFLIEMEQDHIYYVKSINNIHDQEMMDRISMAFMPHEIIEIKRDVRTPIKADNPDFPSIPNTPTYSVKVTLASEISPESARQLVALYTNINNELIVVHKKGEKPNKEKGDDEKDSSVSPDEQVVSDKEAQSTVGDHRVGDLIRDLEKIRKAGEGVGVATVKDVYEAFVTSHRAVSQAVGHQVHRGFYLVEQFEDIPGSAFISGPFTNAPMNYEYQGSVDASKFEYLSESESRDGKFHVFELRQQDYRRGFENPNPNASGMVYPRESRPWEVEVVDTDTGKRYTVAIKAKTKISARNRGIEFVSKQERINPSRLIATKPEVSHRVN